MKMDSIVAIMSILSICYAKRSPPRDEFAVDPKPHNDAIPISPFSTTSSVDDLSCGGIAFCKSYKPDACNTCHCTLDSPAPAMCTKMLCTESLEMPQCIDCMDGYTMENGECIKTTDFKPLCSCPRMYNPVCCSGTTFNSPCEATCGGYSNCQQGTCQDPVAAKLDMDFCATNDHCTAYNDGCNSCRCAADGTSACTKRMCLS